MHYIEYQNISAILRSDYVIFYKNLFLKSPLYGNSGYV